MKGKTHTYQTAVIDGQDVPVRKGQSILEAALKAGIYIPTLCHLEALEPYGGCRLCVVEVKDMRGYPTACTTHLQPGMEVHTRTPALQKLRREILEFTLSEHPYTCLVCKDKNECTDFMHSTRKVSTITGCNFCTSNGDCELQELVDFLDLEEINFPITYRGIPPVRNNPFYDLDYNLCVLCGRCVRICNEERNSHVLAFVERGGSTIVGTAFGESQAEAGCEYCGACVDVCPTGSISEKMGKWRGRPDKSLKTTCAICPLACDMNVNTREGKLLQIGPVPGKRINPHQLCLRGKFLPAEISDHPSRITTPMIRKEDKWIEVSWKTALDTIAGELDKLRGSSFGTIASAQDTLEDNFQLQKFTREVMGSNNLDLHHSYPVRKIPEMIHNFREQEHTAGLADVEKADTLLLFETDAAISHPLLESRIRKAYRKGKQVIRFGAMPNRSSFFTTLEIHHGPGEEELLLQSLLSGLEKNRIPKDKSAHLEAVIPLLEASRNLVLIAGDGMLRKSSAGNIMQLLARLQSLLSTGGVCRILFPGFEGNLYAGALLGLHPDYLPGFKGILAGAQGLSGKEMLRRTGKEGIRAMMVIGDLPVHPGLERLDFLVQFNMFRTELSMHANVLLPLPHFLETEGHVLSLDNKIKKLNRTVMRPGKVESISSIIHDLAKAMGVNGFFPTPADIFREFKPLLSVPVRDKVKKDPFKMKHPPETGFPKVATKNKTYPVSMMILHNHFRYRGNALSNLVPELNSISDEGSLGLPDSMMNELNLKTGDQVRIISANEQMSSPVRIIRGLPNQTGIMMPNGQFPDKIRDEIQEGKRVIQVKIEKV